MNFKNLINFAGRKLVDERATKVAAGTFATLSVITDVLFAISDKGFQLHDLAPLLSLEGLGAVGFIIMFYMNKVAKKGKQKK